MNHDEARSSLAAERYLLNEMTEADAARFEEHFFRCYDCAQDMRQLALISSGAMEMPVSANPVHADTARTSGWLENLREGWSRPAAGLAAAAAILCLALLSVFQARELRHLFQPVATGAFLLLPESRGELTRVSRQEAGPVLVLEADLPGAFGTLKWDLRKAGEDRPVGLGETISPSAGSSLKLVLPAPYLAAGDYTLTVRAFADGEKSWVFPFRVV